MKHLSGFILVGMVVLAGCTTASKTVVPAGSSFGNNPPAYGLNGLVWQQRSGEYRALCYQAFALAKMELQQRIAANKSGARLAIVTDIDETVLDNSPQQAHDLLNNAPYTDESWLNWTNRASAKALPGAVEFFRYADSNNIACFYLSNRRLVERTSTIKNLQAVGFPQADSSHVLLRGESSDKEPRRLQVSASYTVVMLLGDNLNDFDKVFYKQDADTRQQLVDQHHTLFGTRFIVLPNPLYGDWEGALWNGEKITPAEADKRKRAALKSY